MIGCGLLLVFFAFAMSCDVFGWCWDVCVVEVLVRCLFGKQFGGVGLIWGFWTSLPPERMIPHGLVMGAVLGESVTVGDGMRSTACLIS